MKSSESILCVICFPDDLLIGYIRGKNCFPELHK